MAEQRYTTQLSAGLGLFEETRQLLDIWQPGMNTSELYQTALNSGQFSNITARRLRNIVAECFFPRYLRDPLVAGYLQALSGQISSITLLQLMLLYTARANRILADYIRDVYWHKFSAGRTEMTLDDAKTFIQAGLDRGMMQTEWSETTIKRVSSYLQGCCVDFKLLHSESKSHKRITAPQATQEWVIFVAYDLHFQKVGDNSLLSHPDWQLLGLNSSDVLQELKVLAPQNHWIVQSAGNAVQISWRYQSMQEVIDVLTGK